MKSLEKELKYLQYTISETINDDMYNFIKSSDFNEKMIEELINNLQNRKENSKKLFNKIYHHGKANYTRMIEYNNFLINNGFERIFDKDDSDFKNLIYIGCIMHDIGIK